MTRPWFAVARPATPVIPIAGVARHFGLGCDWWPRFDGDGPCMDAVSAATDWYAFDTLIGEEWQAVMAEADIAARYFDAARPHLGQLALLRFDLVVQSGALGWDIGQPSGGHSILMHEPGLPAFAGGPTRLTRDGLFASRQDAADFLALRAAQRGTLALEDVGAWCVVCVSRVDQG